MDAILTALGEFIWAASCTAVNFCLSSGLSVIAIFVSLLSIILASGFFKYMSIHEQVPNDLDENRDLISQQESNEIFTSTNSLSTGSVISESDQMICSSSLEEVQVEITENPHQTRHEKNDEENKSNSLFIDTIEGSEEEIQKQQIANIYRLLNDQNLINNWTSTDFLEQLKMYGLNGYEENELEPPISSME